MAQVILGRGTARHSVAHCSRALCTPSRQATVQCPSCGKHARMCGRGLGGGAPLLLGAQGEATGTAVLACSASLAPHSSAGTCPISASRRGSLLSSYVRWQRWGRLTSVLPAPQSREAARPKPASLRRTATPAALPPELSTQATRSAAGAGGAAAAPCAADADACTPPAAGRRWVGVSEVQKRQAGIGAKQRERFRATRAPPAAAHCGGS